MSKLLENKQLVHITSEIVVLLGLTFYFNQQNKKLMGHIEDLVQRIEDQEDLLQKHEEVIKKLVEYVNQQQTAKTQPVHTPPTPQVTPQVTQQVMSQVTPQSIKSASKSKNVDKLPKKVEKPSKQPVVHAQQKEVVDRRVSFTEEQFNDDSQSDSDLDAEIAQELSELSEADNDDEEIEEFENDSGLKKRA